jgi:hypothetical protein
MSPDPIAQITAPRLGPTHSAREAAALLGRSYSWLGQRLRRGQFILPDGTPCGSYGRRAATGGSPRGCLKTSP